MNLTDPFGPGTPVWEKGDKAIEALRAEHRSAEGYLFGLRRMLAHRGMSKPDRDTYIKSIRAIAHELPETYEGPVHQIINEDMELANKITVIISEPGEH